VKGLDGTPGVNRPAITATVICACVMQGLDTTIVNVSLPHIQGGMSAWGVDGHEHVQRSGNR